MSTVEGNLNHIEDPLRTTESCRYCLMCRHVCPVGHVTSSETLSPHGWALMIASIKRGLLSWGPETIDILYKCADCGLCQSNCVTDQALPTAISAARSEIVQQGMAPLEVQAIDEALKKWSNPFAEKVPEAVTGSGEVALFVGDAARHLSPSVLESALRLLQAAHMKPVLVGVGRSTGFLASSLGLVATATRLAQAVIDEVTQVSCKKLLVLAPGDLYAFTTLYAERLGLIWPTDVEVIETVSFLYDAVQQERLSLNTSESPTSYAYHDPCHAPRVTRNHQAARQLLKAALGQSPAELFWRQQRAHPCGAVGGLELTQPGLSEKLARARFDDSEKAGVSVLITEDPLCLSQLQKWAPSGVEVRGLFETLID